MAVPRVKLAMGKAVLVARTLPAPIRPRPIALAAATPRNLSKPFFIVLFCFAMVILAFLVNGLRIEPVNLV